MRLLGASVTGPGHLHRGQPNQDAWGGKASEHSVWVAVADGMGSKPAARLGAHAAIRAAGTAWRLWSSAESPAPADFARLCEVMWRLGLGSTAPEDACTTLLFVGVRDSGGLSAQLGDGLIAMNSASAYRCLTPERASFGSLTVGMGVPHGLADWTLQPIPRVEPGTAFLLATDGISDDLEPDRVAPMMAWLVKEFAAAKRPGARLRQALQVWPVPHHLDDKTIALAWNPEL
jgi:serine/threonine protein phosphatase PrpC